MERRVTEISKQINELLVMIAFPVAANQMSPAEYQAWLEQEALIAELRSEAMDLNV